MSEIGTASTIITVISILSAIGGAFALGFALATEREAEHNKSKDLHARHLRSMREWRSRALALLEKKKATWQGEWNPEWDKVMDDLRREE